MGEKKRKLKEQEANDLKLRNAKKKETDKKFKDSHERKPKKIAAKERVGTDWNKIEKQREEIRRIKEKRRLEKEKGIKPESKVVFGDQHEAKSKSKRKSSVNKKSKKEIELDKKRAETKAMQRRRASQNKMGIKPKGKIKFGDQNEK